LEARDALDNALFRATAGTIAVIDDVITMGAHFVTVRNKLRQAFPTTKIVGLFIARHVPETVDVEDFEI
jgi:orotate phosphoribosyltransferase-like protein